MWWREGSSTHLLFFQMFLVLMVFPTLIYIPTTIPGFRLDCFSILFWRSYPCVFFPSPDLLLLCVALTILLDKVCITPLALSIVLLCLTSVFCLSVFWTFTVVLDCLLFYGFICYFLDWYLPFDLGLHWHPLSLCFCFLKVSQLSLKPLIHGVCVQFFIGVVDPFNPSVQ